MEPVSQQRAVLQEELNPVHIAHDFRLEFPDKTAGTLLVNVVKVGLPDEIGSSSESSHSVLVLNSQGRA